LTADRTASPSVSAFANDVDKAIAVGIKTRKENILFTFTPPGTSRQQLKELRRVGMSRYRKATVLQSFFNHWRGCQVFMAILNSIFLPFAEYSLMGGNPLCKSRHASGLVFASGQTAIQTRLSCSG
jgi:hypothetical protein